MLSSVHTAFATTPPRYASPTGTSAQDCATPATACDIATAIDGTGANTPVSGQEIVVEPGTYTLSGTLAPTVDTVIHGVDGQPRPVIKADGFPVLYPSSAFSLKLTYLEFDIHNAGGSDSINTFGATFDRVLIKGDSGPGNLCQCYDGTIRNSVIIDSAATGSAWGINSNGGTSTETLRNDTFIATQSGASAMWIAQGGASPIGPTTADAKNVIAINTAGGNDVRASGKQVTITMAYSDYANPLAQLTGVIADGGHNVGAAPSFVDVATGDVRERAVSPTVNAGFDDVAVNGPLDFAGNPRQAGAHTDIGALEYQPPAVISSVSGTPQSASVGQPFAHPLAVEVTDAQGQPVQDVVVTFTAPGTGASGSFPGGLTAQAVTGSDGVATAPALTAGHAAGGYSIVASIAEIPMTASIALHNLPGAPASLVLTPAARSVPAGRVQSYVAEAFDAFGNDAGRAAAHLAISPNGSCSASACAALVPGHHTVTATVGTAHGTASLVVDSVGPTLAFARRPAVTIKRRARAGFLHVTCRAPASEVCVVTGSLTGRTGGRTMTLGTVSGRLTAGRRGTLRIHLTRTAAARLGARGRTVRALLHVTDPSGSAHVRVTLRLSS